MARGDRLRAMSLAADMFGSDVQFDKFLGVIRVGHMIGNLAFASYGVSARSWGDLLERLRERRCEDRKREAREWLWAAVCAASSGLDVTEPCQQLVAWVNE